MRTWRWANVPLPEPHLGSIVAGVVLGFIFPRRLFPAAWVGHVVGWPFIVAGVALAAWSVRAAGEQVLERPAGLVVRGPYAFSRNPMYLAWHLLYLGIASILNNAWLLALLPLALLMTHLVIVREERQLYSRLGQSYRAYRQRVRRYL
jgi:protein-S-isoprenylcysteine O-methyltransferase Ste14